MTPTETFGGREPGRWYLVFHVKRSTTWWVNLLGGRFKHVSAFGYVCGHGGLYVLHDANLSGIQVVTYTVKGMNEMLMRWVGEGAVVVLLPEDGKLHMGLRCRLGLWCVSAAKHVTGVRSFALTGAGLYNHVLRHGGQVISGGSKVTDRPIAASRASGG